MAICASIGKTLNSYRPQHKNPKNCKPLNDFKNCHLILTCQLRSFYLDNWMNISEGRNLRLVQCTTPAFS